MSTPTTNTATIPASRKHSIKPTKNTKVIVLRLPPSRLDAFPHSSPVANALPAITTTISPLPTPLAEVTEPSPVEEPPDTNATPDPGAAADDDKLAPPPNGIKRKGLLGPKPGAKRGLALAADGMSKPRGKPGPKKKPRLEDGTIDHSATAKKGPFGNLATLPSGKPNPKGKDGAINANLRALDRSGKPCRRWERKGLQLKTFTNVDWTLPSWRTPKSKNAGFPGDVSSDSTASSEIKPNLGSSQIESEKSTSGTDVDGTTQQINLANSPAPVAATPA